MFSGGNVLLTLRPSPEASVSEESFSRQSTAYAETFARGFGLRRKLQQAKPATESVETTDEPGEVN